MNLLMIILFFNHLFSLNYSKYCISQEYIPLEYFTIKTLIITNPCNTKTSILIRNNSLYKFDQEQSQWKRLCISKKIFNNQIPIVNSIAHLNNDLILIINKNLFRTQDIISSSINNDIIYRLLHYSNVPILFDNIDYVFTTPCCTCTSRSISYVFNDYIILANKNGDVILFYMKSLTIVYNFKNIFHSQTICQSNQCTILYLGLIHSLPILICIIQYQIEKAILFHQVFLELNSTFQKSMLINFTGDTLYITPSSIPNSYFFWDEKTIYYTLNNGEILSEIKPNGCDQLKISSTNEIYCLNLTIDYLYISNNEFFIITQNNKWLYGKESLFPSMIYLQQECFLNSLIPEIDYQCLNQSLPCSDFIQLFCSYINFQPLFNINQIYILEKNTQISLKFILESYKIIPIMISSTKSKFFNYSINYTINYLTNGIIQIIGNILISTTNQMNNDYLGSSLISFRLGLVQYSYSCNQTSSFSFQIEASCSSASSLRVEGKNEFNYWWRNHSNIFNDIKWIHQFSPIYIKCKQTDSILLKYQYCFNNSCQSISNNQLDDLIIYAIPLNKDHEDYAHYLINRTDSCISISRLIYRLWIKSILSIKTRSSLFQIPYERRTFYRTLLNILSISNKSCLFFNGSNPIYINKTINQVSDNDLKFILHIIAYNNKFSFCDLETFILIEIEPIHNLFNSYRGFIFLITLILFIVLFILFIHIYTYYKKQQRKINLEYHRLNQIDAGQFHQWYDIARYLNQNTDNYNSIEHYLQNFDKNN